MYAVSFLVGLVLLLAGAEVLVRGASSLATRAGLPAMVVGLTVVSFGTSLPELLVTFVSGLQHNADLAVANVIGSNIANVLLVLGVAASIRPLPVHDATVVSEVPFSLTAALLVGFLANAALFSTTQELSISRLDGAILLSFFLLFMAYVYKVSSADSTHGARGVGAVAEPQTATDSTRRAAASIAGGLVMLYFGGGWVVDGAVGMAQAWNVDDALVGLTIVAVGTSAPEVFTSAVAAYRGHTEIAVGNVVGSNIFNLLLVLGGTATVVELPFEALTNTDLVMVIAASALLILAPAASRSNEVSRGAGIGFVALYGAYVVYAISRG